jgi:hypothetical protein
MRKLKFQHVFEFLLTIGIAGKDLSRAPLRGPRNSIKNYNN